VDPAEADRLLERLGVAEGTRWRPLLGELKPGPAGRVVVLRQPALPCGLVGELDDREVILGHSSRERTGIPVSGAGRASRAFVTLVQADIRGPGCGSGIAGVRKPVSRADNAAHGAGRASRAF